MATADSTVIYKDIPGFPGYQVGSDGTVWRRWVNTRWGRQLTPHWRPMKLTRNAKGYLRVNLTPPGKPYRTFKVHRLVLLIFVGPCPEGMECRHRNGIKKDNRLSNLRWGTPIDNRGDNHANGSYQKGESHPMHELTEAQVNEIRQRYEDGALMRELAIDFRTSVSNVSAIVNRRSWKHLTPT